MSYARYLADPDALVDALKVYQKKISNGIYGSDYDYDDCYEQIVGAGRVIDKIRNGCPEEKLAADLQDIHEYWVNDYQWRYDNQGKRIAALATGIVYIQEEETFK